MQSSTRNLSRNQEEGITFSNFSLKLATDIIGQSAFGIDFGLSKEGSPDKSEEIDDEASAFIKEHVYSTTSLKMDLSGSLSIIIGLLIPILQEPLRQVLMRIPGTVDWKIEKSNTKLSKRLDDIVAERAREKKRDRKDFLSVILDAREARKASRGLFTSHYITALSYEQLLAGSTTSSFTLSSLLYLVSKHPEVEKKLLEEIDGYDPHDLVPDTDDLQHKFPYLDQGTWVWLAPGVVAKDPKNFPDPDAFLPSRFDPGLRRGAAEASLCTHPIWSWPKKLHWPKVRIFRYSLKLESPTGVASSALGLPPGHKK